MSSARGVALVLVAGLLGLLTLLAAAFARVAAIGGAASRAAVSRTAAALAAESGLAYAAARLWQNLFPLPLGTPESARDDWTSRGEVRGTPPAALDNPSYRRGDHWIDDGNGRRDPGEPLAPSGDLDENGRCDAFSGRLRDAGRSHPASFSLRIASAQGLVCVNSGETGSPDEDHDLDGVLNALDPEYDDIPPDAYRDPTYHGNVHLTNLLDNLGAVIGLSDVYDERFAPVPPATEPFPGAAARLGTIRLSRLGRIIIENRPKGGYKSLDDIRPFLPEEDFARAAPFLTTDGEKIPFAFPLQGVVGAGFATLYNLQVSTPDDLFEFHARIDANAAPVEVLQATLRNIASGTLNFDQVFVRLLEDEADRLAERFAARRPIHAWGDLLAFLRDLHDAFPPVFEDDPFTAVDETFDPERRRLKEDLILAQIADDDYVPDPMRWTANTLALPRQDPPLGTDATAVRQIFKIHLFGPLDTTPYGYDGGLSSEPIHAIPSRRTTAWTLSHVPSRFSVESGGRSGREEATARGRLTIAEGSVPLRSQRDFEEQGASLPSPRVYPGGAVRAVAPARRREIHTFPRFPLISAATGDTTYRPTAVPPGTPEVHAQHAYPKGLGGVALAALQWPYADRLERTAHALPFNEDFPDAPETTYDPTSWEDNLFDPVDPTRRAEPPLFSTWLSLYARDPFNVFERYPDFHAGLRHSPLGPRTGNMAVSWGTFPLPRGTHDGTGVAGAGEIQAGAIDCWYPTLGGDPPRWFDVHINAPAPGFYMLKHTFSDTCLTVIPRSDGSVEIRTALESRVYAPLAPLPWHHLSIRFDSSSFPPGSDKTLVTVYIDGVRGAPPCVLLMQGSPADATMTMDVHFPLDDIFLFKPPLDREEEIVQRARASRFAARGVYVSPRLAFDDGLLPEGAVPLGLAWDGFVPPGTGGAFAFTTVGYDADGLSETGRCEVFWNGVGLQTASLRGIGPSRQAAVLVTIATDRDAWPLVDGVPSLRDTPFLNTLEIVYGRRPRWRGFPD